MKHLALLAALAAVPVAACSSSSGSGAVPPILATPVPAGCTGGVGGLPDTTCRRVRITGAGLAPVEVELRVSEPDAGATYAGTVLVGSGGEGTTYLGDAPEGATLLALLQANGFRVVDRVWLTGWFTTGEDPRAQSERYAALLDWVRDEVHTGGALCALGNSGGSAEIAYALSTWGARDVLDVAVLGSGPPMSRLDWTCEDPASTEWASLCATLQASVALDCTTPSCTPPPDLTLCTFLPAAPAPGELEEMSVLHPNAVLDFPGTVLIGLLGSMDCTNALPLGLHFFDQVASPVDVRLVERGEHFLPTTTEGRDAILAALLDGVFGPTTFAVPTLRFDLLADDGGVLMYGEVVEPETDAVVGKLYGYRAAAD